MPAPRGVISSPSNPLLVEARELHKPRARRVRREFLAEGVRLVADALDAGAQPLRAFVAPELIERNDPGRQLLARLPGERVDLTASALRSISDTETPQGIVAVFPIPPDDSTPSLGRLTLLLDGLQDPGNLGTVLRSALGCGVVDTILIRGGADPYGPKAVRAAAAALFRLRIARPPDQLLGDLLRDERVLLADASAGETYDAADWLAPAVLVVGSEGSGPSSFVRRFASGGIAVPLAGGLESLNAGVAASIILFEAARQRRATTC